MAAVDTSTKRIIHPKKKVEKTALKDVSAPAPAPAPASVPVPVSAPTSYCDPSLFTKRTIKRTLTIPFYHIKYGIDIQQLLTSELAKRIEGHCSVEGYICPKSICIHSHSGGTLAGANIAFDIIADCLVCFPAEHSVIQCVAKTVTQAGIRAGATQLTPGAISPIEVFLSRDMNMKNSVLFSRIEENDILTVEVIGRRFVLHDTHVTIIAMLLDAVSQPSPPST
jgi:hypothetical protein